MISSVPVIANPLSLCAYIVSAVAGVTATAKWNAKNDSPGEKRKFYLFATVCLLAMVGGLFLAWNESPKPALPAGSGAVVQKSSGDQSPNINSSGTGPITVQSGASPSPSSEKPPEKKK